MWLDSAIYFSCLVLSSITEYYMNRTKEQNLLHICSKMFPSLPSQMPNSKHLNTMRVSINFSQLKIVHDK